MEQDEPLETARRIVEERVPGAIGAVLAGSVLTSRRSATSDLDIVVFVADEDESFRETVESSGWLAELFVQTRSTFNFYVAQETTARRSTLLSMCAEGAALFSIDGTTERYQEEALRLLALGPPPLTKEEVDRARYMLTDLLEDLAGVTDASELTFIIGQLLTMSAELALSNERQWLGTGKWLARRLEQWNPELMANLNGAARTAMTTHDRSRLRSVVLDVLRPVGGPLAVGFRERSDVAKGPTIH